ncbi:HTTM domain-containing protein, partial [Natrinema soli]
MTGDRSTLTTADGESTTLASLRAFGRSRLGIDPRALAAFRIGLGLVVLCDLLFLRVPGLGTFYTDEGVLPRSALAEASPTLATWSLHALSGSVWLQALLVSIAGGAAACLLVGYRHRLAAVVSALLLASLFARNPSLVNG